MFFGDFFSLFRENSVCFGCFDTGLKHRNKPNKMFFGLMKQTGKQPKQIEFRFVSVRTEKKKFDCFEYTLPQTLTFVCMMRSLPTSYWWPGLGLNQLIFVEDKQFFIILYTAAWPGPM
jgi:hypothetical protein